jgi:hypothetical protein
MGWRSARRVLVVPVVLITLVTLMSPTVSAEQRVLSALTSEPGTFEFLALDFGENERVSVWVTGPQQQVQAMDDIYTTNRDGNVGFTIRMPRHFQPGRWAITVHGLNSEREAIGFFEMPALGPDVALDIDRTSGPAGTTFAFGSNAFRSGEQVDYWLTGPDGRAYVGGAATVNSAGRLDFVYTIPAGAQPGQWTMSAYGMESNRLGQAQFTVE